MIEYENVNVFDAANSIKLLPEDQDFRIIFGKSIHKLRLMLGFSKEYVANILGFHIKLMSKFESGTESKETFYDCIDKILRFYRHCVRNFLVTDPEYFAWLFDISFFVEQEIAFFREKFENFVNHDFYVKPFEVS